REVRTLGPKAQRFGAGEGNVLDRSGDSTHERASPVRRPRGEGTKPHMNSEDNPDLELAGRAAARDEGAWRASYLRHRERLFSLLVFQLGSREEALDVLQDTYVSAIRGIGRYRGEGSLEAWMAGIALHQAQGWKRRFLAKRKRTESLPESFDPPAASDGTDP